MIPKVLHFIWIQGIDQRPPDYVDSWKKRHPNWSIQLWDERRILSHFNDKIDDVIKVTGEELPTVIQKADFWRLVILYFIGGVYADLDLICLKPLEPYIVDKHFVATEEHDGIIANGFIACIPKHPLIKVSIDHICSTRCDIKRLTTESMDYRKTILETTGPHILSKLWKKHIPYLRKSHIYIEKDTSIFFPIKYGDCVGEKKCTNSLLNGYDIDKLYSLYPKSIAAHVYWQSWC